jgi:hypothetical protein
VQQNGVARLACTRKTENQWLSVQQIATQEVRKGARNGHFVSFGQSAVIAFNHAGKVSVWGVVAQVR